VSTARFDEGQTFFWQPDGVYSATQNASSGPTELVALSGAPLMYYRMDWASVIISYGSTADLSVWADLSLSPDSANRPFLSVSAVPEDGWLPLTSQKRWITQLSLPFVFYGLTYISLFSAVQAGGGSSTAEATIGLSVAFPIG
jgi:hypothetical protein